MLNVGVIGIGNCGNQVAKLAFSEARCDAFVINTSENDLATIPDAIPRKCVGDAQGSGKNRDAAKAFLKNSIMELMRDESFAKFMAEKEVVLVVSSMGGGSGSGIAPIMSSIIRDAFRAPDGSELITILVGVLPKLSEGYSTQVNALDYTHELYNVLENPTYMIFDNNNFTKETSYKVLERVNKEIIDCIKVMQCVYNLPTPYDSIDEKDMKTLLSSPGRIFISTLLDVKEKDLDNVTIEDLLIDTFKKSAHAEMQRDGIVARTGLITNLSEKLNSEFDTHIEKVRSFVGEPTEEFLHVTVNSEKAAPNNVALIITGLTKIVDRIDKIRDRIDEIEAKNDALEAAEAEVTSEDIEKMNARRNYRKSTVPQSEVNIGSIFDKFGVK